MDKVWLGNKLSSLRKNKKIAQSKLAKASNISPSLLSKIESGKCFPSLLTVVNISNALGVELEEIFKNNSDEVSIDLEQILENQNVKLFYNKVELSQNQKQKLKEILALLLSFQSTYSSYFRRYL